MPMPEIVWKNTDCYEFAYWNKVPIGRVEKTPLTLPNFEVYLFIGSERLWVKNIKEGRKRINEQARKWWQAATGEA